jgi:hypothetical protein
MPNRSPMPKEYLSRSMVVLLPSASDKYRVSAGL